MPIDQPFGGLVLAAKRIYVGDTDWDGSPAPGSAWRDFGHDLDGILTFDDFTGHCQPNGNVPQQQAHLDGYDGIDNSFGNNILPILMGFALDYSEQVNIGILEGAFGYLLALSGETTANVSTAYHNARDFEAGCWSVAPEGVSAGDPGAPLVSIPGGAFYEGDRFESSVAPTGVIVELWLYPLRLPIEQARLTIESGPTPSGTVRVNLGGIIRTEALVDSFAAIAGTISEELCSGSTFDSLANQIRVASDIMSDGTQNPNAPCDAISIGIGFEMVPSSICGVGEMSDPPTSCF